MAKIRYFRNLQGWISRLVPGLMTETEHIQLLTQNKQFPSLTQK